MWFMSLSLSSAYSFCLSAPLPSLPHICPITALFQMANSYSSFKSQLRYHLQIHSPHLHAGLSSPLLLQNTVHILFKPLIKVY